MRITIGLMFLGVGGLVIGCGSEVGNKDLTSCTSTPIDHGQTVACDSAAAGGDSAALPGEMPSASTGTGHRGWWNGSSSLGSSGGGGGGGGGGEPGATYGMTGSSSGGSSDGTSDTNDAGGGGSTDDGGTTSSSSSSSSSGGGGSSSGGSSGSPDTGGGGSSGGPTSPPTCTTDGSSQHCVWTKCDPGYHPMNGCCVPDMTTKGNNGVGNGLDPQPPGNPPVNDGVGTSPGDPAMKKAP